VHLHAGARWSLQREGAAPAGEAGAPLGRDPSVYRGRVESPTAGFRLELDLAATQPLLLQGQAGWSRKGPKPAQASFYTSQPQLAVRARLALDGQSERALTGRAWLDHEWSETLLDADAAGWDWIGMNLFDGSALTAFRLRRAAGTGGATAASASDAATAARPSPYPEAVWAGGSWRPRGAQAQPFAPDAVRFTPLRHWTSPRHAAAGQAAVRYPVQWRVDTPAGRFIVQALLDDQELDSRASTGTVYWEGLSELLDAATGRRIGLGYLEMTGYVERLRL
jgi:predicted secreted hydrolase